MLPLSWMLPSASIVSVAALPADLMMSAPAFCTMLPVAVPALAVVMVTSVPALSAVLIAPLLTVAALVDGVNVPPLTASFALAAVLMVTLVGSMSHAPALPFGAAAETTPCTLRLRPEVSTKPPLPRAASALIEAPASTWVKLAKFTPSCMPTGAASILCSESPPTMTLPPSCWPLASMDAPLNTPTRSPDSTTVPPFTPEASILPRTATSPVLPASATTVPALTTPDRFTTEFSSVSLPRPVSSTEPLPALMLPVFSTSALAVASVSLSEMPCPFDSATIALSPAASTTLAALMSPELRTRSPASTT
ncbi:hypothetical protein LMG28727_07688 [Paraburkholderia kirstenboschensis]|nr:hypothetical protein LMG28727_07688 [Paraburkholderia kirstenboschensis]